MAKLIFMGTSDFACKCLDSLERDNLNIDLIVTRQDSVAGRNRAKVRPPVKKWAQARDIPLWQPRNINSPESIARLQKLDPDLLVVVAYGKILSKKVLDIPALGAINVHASLLPNLRGAAPIEWSIIRGYTETGVTTMYMDEGLDTGDIILQKAVDIQPHQTGAELHESLATLAQELLPETVRLVYQGQAPRTPQPQGETDYAPVLDSSVERIDWERSAQEISNYIRALAPKPGCYTSFRGRRLKVLAATATGGSAQPGEVVGGSKKLLVGTGQGLLELCQVQPAGKKIISAQDFLNGYRVREGELFQ